MPKTLKIVGLGGSLAGNSKSRAALRTALDGAASAGAGQVEEGLAHLGSPHCQDCRDERRAISPERFLALSPRVVAGIDMVAIARQRRNVGELDGMRWAA